MVLAHSAEGANEWSWVIPELRLADPLPSPRLSRGRDFRAHDPPSQSWSMNFEPASEAAMLSDGYCNKDFQGFLKFQLLPHPSLSFHSLARHRRSSLGLRDDGMSRRREQRREAKLVIDNSEGSEGGREGGRYEPAP